MSYTKNNHFLSLLQILFMVTIFLPLLVLGRKYPSFGEYETDYRRQGIGQIPGEGYYTDQFRQQEERGGFSKNNGWESNFGSDQFAQPFNHQNIFSSQQQISRRYALDGNSINEDSINADGPNNNFDEGLNTDGLDREAKDQYYNFGGWPSGFNSEGDGWGDSSGFYSNGASSDGEGDNNNGNAQDKFVDASNHHLGGENSVFEHNFPSFHSPSKPSFDHHHQPHHQPSHPISHAPHPHFGGHKHRPSIDYGGNTIGTKKKQHYKQNVLKANELLFGPGGITKDKINKAVKEFGDAYVGEENKDEILYHTNKIVKDLHKNTNKFKNNLDQSVLAIGDATIGDKTKNLIRYKANEIITTTIPFLRGTSDKFHTNSIHSKVKHKTKATLDEINYQTNAELHKFKKNVPKAKKSLMKKFNHKARQLARKVLGKYFYSSSSSSKKKSDSTALSPVGNTHDRQAITSLGYLATSATVMIFELILLAVQGTPSLYGPDILT